MVSFYLDTIYFILTSISAPEGSAFTSFISEQIKYLNSYSGNDSAADRWHHAAFKAVLYSNV